MEVKEADSVIDAKVSNIEDEEESHFDEPSEL